MGQFKRTVRVYPQREGEFALDNGKKIFFCKNGGEVAENLEEALWPILALPLASNKEITITITYKTNE